MFIHTPTLRQQGHESYQSHRQFGTMTVAFSYNFDNITAKVRFYCYKSQSFCKYKRITKPNGCGINNLCAPLFLG